MFPRNTYSTELFTYSKTAGTFAADYSDLDPRLDLAQGDLNLVSHKTGSLATYHLSRVDKDIDGDVSAWVFLPGQDARVRLGLQDTAIIIFND